MPGRLFKSSTENGRMRGNQLPRLHQKRERKDSPPYPHQQAQSGECFEELALFDDNSNGAWLTLQRRVYTVEYGSIRGVLRADRI
jgi:hypothetical protein